MFLEKIEELKEQEGSYSKVAKKIGITRAALSAITRGVTQPKEETIISLCKVLKTEPDLMIIEAQINRNSGNVKKAWLQIEKKLASVAAVTLIGTAIPSFLASAQSILC